MGEKTGQRLEMTFAICDLVEGAHPEYTEQEKDCTFDFSHQTSR